MGRDEVPVCKRMPSRAKERPADGVGPFCGRAIEKRPDASQKLPNLGAKPSFSASLGPAKAARFCHSKARWCAPSHPILPACRQALLCTAWMLKYARSPHRWEDEVGAGPFGAGSSWGTEAAPHGATRPPAPLTLPLIPAAGRSGTRTSSGPVAGADGAAGSLTQTGSRHGVPGGAVGPRVLPRVAVLSRPLPPPLAPGGAAWGCAPAPAAGPEAQATRRPAARGAKGLRGLLSWRWCLRHFQHAGDFLLNLGEMSVG